MNSVKNFAKKILPHVLPVLTILLLDILLIYYFRPPNPLMCLLLAIIICKITLEDYYTQLIDLRLVLMIFLIGIMLTAENRLGMIFETVCSFSIMHILHEVTAKIVPASVDLVADFHYLSSHDVFSEDNAPPFVPCLTIALIVVLFYYLMVFPIPLHFQLIAEQHNHMLYIASKNTSITLVAIGVLLTFCLAFYIRNKRALKNNKAIIYKGLGDGDIYLIGVYMGLLGYPMMLAVVFVSLFPAWLQIKYLERKARIV